MTKPKFGRLDYEQVKKLAQYGHTDAFMAEFFGVSPKTWASWKKTYPAFSEELKKWKDIADEKVEEALFKKALGYYYDEVTYEVGGEFEYLQKLLKSEIKLTPQYKKRVVTKKAHPDTNAIIFWLKNRKRDEWRDRQDITHEGELKLAEAIVDARKRLKK